MNQKMECKSVKQATTLTNNDLGIEYSNKSAYQLSTKLRQSNNTDKHTKKQNPEILQSTARARSAPPSSSRSKSTSVAP